MRATHIAIGTCREPATMSDALMVALIVLAVLGPAAYASLCRWI
jgi:hypothetical protein